MMKLKIYVFNVVKFDFVGIFLDVSSVQIPEWRPLFEESNTVEILWNLYLNIVNHAQFLILSILVYLSTIRRSLFTAEEERKNYLQNFFKWNYKFIKL
jgi:hypothetical protein